ncbi:GNAT family N-acetyltransferase [Kribbella sp. NPDC023855]|uniref:GNAT family N-acetyltransferase n=1 Tax=Kribbella sp. NPDC023855 TaxID=3154698 RepID=UPI003402DFD5
MQFPEDVPVLTDGVVRLRAHTAADVAADHDLGQDPEVQRWTGVPVPYHWSDAEKFVTERIPAGWRDGSAWCWAIDFDGRYAGSVELRDGVGGVGDIGFSLAPWARGRGVMTRAVQLAVGYSFDQLGWDRVLWRGFVGNWGSRRVAWKCGFREFVTTRGTGRARGVRYDEWVASIDRYDERVPHSRWWDVPVIEGDGFRLRPLRPGDAARIVEASNDDRTRHWLSGLPTPYELSHAESFIQRWATSAADGDAVSWAIADRDSDDLLANLSIFRLGDRIDPTAGEIGYWTHPAARGRGLMTAAVRLAVRHAFTPITDGGLGRRRLVLIAAEGNTASDHIAASNGFTHMGTARAAEPRRDGTYSNLRHFDLLATDHLDSVGPLGCRSL